MHLGDGARSQYRTEILPYFDFVAAGASQIYGQSESFWKIDQIQFQLWKFLSQGIDMWIDNCFTNLYMSFYSSQRRPIDG